MPQYEPPEKLKPAMAEVIIKERITGKGAWSATIIDLAVRGYVSITGRIKTNWLNIGRRDYKILKLKSFDNPELEDYEKKFLELLFTDKDYFSTKEFRRRGNTIKQEFVMALRDLQKQLYKETEQDTKAYIIGRQQKLKTITWALLFGLSPFLIIFVGGFFGTLGVQFQYVFLVWVITITSLALRAFFKYEARLSKDGQILKEEWLGFKLYLETAENIVCKILRPICLKSFYPTP